MVVILGVAGGVALLASVFAFLVGYHRGRRAGVCWYLPEPDEPVQYTRGVAYGVNTGRHHYGGA